MQECWNTGIKKYGYVVRLHLILMLALMLYQKPVNRHRPKAAAAAISIIIWLTLNPIFAQIGTNKTANIGIVPKDVPIPIVINNPKISINNDVKTIFFRHD